MTIYDNSYETFQTEFSFAVWKKEMDALINNINCQHKKRNGAFEPNMFLTYRNKQNRMGKYNMRHLLIYEYLPSALPFYKYYFNFIIQKWIFYKK